MTEPNKPEIETLEYRPEQPNENICIIEKIEGLISRANIQVDRLDVMSDNVETTNERRTAKSQALDEIDLIQKTTLFKLRKAFE